MYKSRLAIAIDDLIPQKEPFRREMLTTTLVQAAVAFFNSEWSEMLLPGF
jgi:hypothetical protein